MVSTVAGQEERHTDQPGDRTPHQEHVTVSQGGHQEYDAGNRKQAPSDQVEAAARGQPSPVKRLNSTMRSSTGSARAWMPVQ